MPRLLIVDDEQPIRVAVKLALLGEDFVVDEAQDLDSAFKMISDDTPDLMLLDVHFPHGRTCHQLLSRMRAEGINVPTVILSGAASAEDAVAAIRMGALDFIEKPVASERLKTTLRNCLELARMRQAYTQMTTVKRATADLIGTSAAMGKVRQLIRQFAGKDVKVLVTGPTGTGKEVVAHALWQASQRQGRPFIVVNAAAVPEALLESELFGHRKGAFTGATSVQIGKIELADKGTLFLDEVGELSLSAQSKLLRFLETGEMQTLGSSTMKRSDVRLIAATSRNLEEEMRRGHFREDLYFRLNVARIELPPLSARGEDVSELFTHFLLSLCQRYNEPPPLVMAEAMSILQRYTWPGNVRELRNVAERALLLAHGVISPEIIEDLIPRLHPASTLAEGQHAGALPKTEAEIVPLRDFRRSTEAAYISHVLGLAGSVTKAASLLKVDRSHLHEKLHQLGLARSD